MKGLSICRPSRGFFGMACSLALAIPMLGGSAGCRYNESNVVERAVTKDRPDPVKVRSPGTLPSGARKPPNTPSPEDVVPSPPASVLGTRSPPPPPATAP